MNLLRRGMGEGEGDAAALLEAFAQPAAICDEAGRPLLRNAAWLAAMGPARLPIGGEGLYAPFRAALAEGEARGTLPPPLAGRAARLRRLGPGRVLVLVEPAPPPAAAPDLDVRKSRTEAVGLLAQGVAHDFNNLLTIVRMRAQDLLQRHPLGDPDYEGLSEIVSVTGRAAAVVRQLLSFTRKATVRREVIDVAAALTDVEVLLRRLLRESMVLQTRYEPHLPDVHMDRSQLETAIVNLVVNARDALGERPGGVIRLEARPAACADGRRGVAIVVSDNGPGVPGEVAGRIFEPFFTTKAAGEGTGLGLAGVQGIVEQAGGRIALRSAPGQGAAFEIVLPAHAPAVQLETPPRDRPAGPRPDLSGVGRILLVEDEPLVRGATARLLRARGYEVIEAEDGEAALELAQANAGRIDLLISDVIMPGLDGPGLLRAARPYLGKAPVLFVSGYAESEFSDVLEGEPGVAFLSKPLDVRALAEQVKTSLEGAL